MFNSPTEEGIDPDDTSSEGPISLPGVTATEFKAPLDYFYLPFVLNPLKYEGLLIPHVGQAPWSVMLKGRGAKPTDLS